MKNEEIMDYLRDWPVFVSVWRKLSNKATTCNSYFKRITDSAGQHCSRVRRDHTSGVQRVTISYAGKNLHCSTQSGGCGCLESAADAQLRATLPAGESGQSECRGDCCVKSDLTRPEPSQPKKIADMPDIQTILKDLSAFAPIIETALGLDANVKATITTLTVIGEGIAGLLTTLQGQISTVSQGGQVDFNALNETLNALVKQTEAYIAVKESEPVKQV